MTIDDWREVTVSDVAGADPGHAIHAYFNASPESPDGRWVVYARSGRPDAERADVCLRSRADGELRVLDADVECEDAHRVACQHWAGDGQVVWHRLRGGRFEVLTADPAGGEPRVLAENRLTGWGRPGQRWLPLYGPHWDAAAPRDLLLVDLRSGETRVGLSIDDLRAADGAWVDATFGPDAPVSFFFPILSPDGNRVMCKIACPAGGDMRSKAASQRHGILVWDLPSRRLLWRDSHWGHPAWSPDSRHIVNVQNLIVDAATGQTTQHLGVPHWPMSHPSWHPSGEFYVTDTQLNRLGYEPGWWALVLVRRDGSGYRIIHRFDNRGGASSWRIPHPHPVFSPDGERLYANINHGPHTRLACLAPA
jgi:Tol biopolymer transport system component